MPERYKMSGRAVRYLGIFLCTAAAIGGVLAATFYRYTDQKLTEEVAQLQFAYSSDGSLLYGVVQSTDIPDSSILVQIQNRFDPTQGVPIEIVIGPNTILASQTMTQSDGVYDGVSALQTISIADITPGMQVAIHGVARDADGRISADMLLVGDPL